MEQVTLHKPALLITGTIVPNSNFVAHQNVNDRRNEYYDALLFYRAQFPHNDLYFLENSTYDFTTDIEFEKLFQLKNIKLLKFPVSHKTLLGKGYQEFEMLDKTIELLGNNYTSFIKITGRYKVLNLVEITNVSCKTLIADSQKTPKVTQTNVFYVSTIFYNSHLKNLYLQVNDDAGIYIEHLVYDTLVKNNLLKKTQLFKKNPIITGFSGSYGGTLNRNKYKMILRNIERKLIKLVGIHQFLIEY